MNSRNRSLQCVGTEAAGLQGSLQQRQPFGDLLPVPERAILVLEQDQLLRSEKFSRRAGIPVATSGKAARLLPALGLPALAGVRSATSPVEPPRRLARSALPALPPQPNNPR